MTTAGLPKVPGEFDFFNVFTADYEIMGGTLEGTGADGRILYMSDDRSHLVIASRYPEGAQFTYGADVDFLEAFYVVSGHGSRTFADGTSVEMKAGDLIFVRPGIDVDYVYGPGFFDVAFFWSTDKALPAGLGEGPLHRGATD